MSILADRAVELRARIEAADLADGKTIVVKCIRLRARELMFDYARRHWIVDFADTDLVEDRHRARRDQIVTRARDRGGEAMAATTTQELLTVFDQVVTE